MRPSAKEILDSFRPEPCFASICELPGLNVSLVGTDSGHYGVVSNDIVKELREIGLLKPPTEIVDERYGKINIPIVEENLFADRWIYHPTCDYEAIYPNKQFSFLGWTISIGFGPRSKRWVCRPPTFSTDDLTAFFVRLKDAFTPT
jgi:hypothetical protein